MTLLSFFRPSFTFLNFTFHFLICFVFSSFYQGVVLLNLLETKVNLNCLLFSQRERESPKSSQEGVGQVVRWCWVNFPTNLDGPIALAVVQVGVVWTFFVSCIFSLFFLPLWETAQYRLKYCLKGPLNPKQPTNQIQSLVV